MARFSYNQRYLDANGDPLAGGKLYFYESGTTTPKTTYSEVSQTTPNTNPVILDAGGLMSDVFFTGSVKLVIKDADDVQINVIDPVGGDTLSAAEVKTLYESNDDTNAFTDADETNVIDALDGATIPNATIAADDKVLFQDASDSDNLKQDDATSLVDLAGTLSYTGLANDESTGTKIEMVLANAGILNPYSAVVRHSNTSDRGILSGSTGNNADSAILGLSLNTGSITATTNVDVLLFGFVKNTSWSWTQGDPIYLSSTTGGISSTKPGSGYTCQVGIAVDTDIIFVNPGPAEAI
jgi:hypothetical protein